MRREYKFRNISEGVGLKEVSLYRGSVRVETHAATTVVAIAMIQRSYKVLTLGAVVGKTSGINHLKPIMIAEGVKSLGRLVLRSRLLLVGMLVQMLLGLILLLLLLILPLKLLLLLIALLCLILSLLEFMQRIVSLLLLRLLPVLLRVLRGRGGLENLVLKLRKLLRVLLVLLVLGLLRWLKLSRL